VRNPARSLPLSSSWPSACRTSSTRSAAGAPEQPVGRDARRGPPDRGSARIELPGRGEGGASRGVVSARALVRGYVREGEGVAMDTEQAPRRVRGARDERLVEAPDEIRQIALLPRGAARGLPHERERLPGGGPGPARAPTGDAIGERPAGRRR